MASYCSKCGKDLSDGTRFCPSCGFDTMGQGSSSGNSNYNQNYSPNNNQVHGMGGTLTVIAVLGILWTIVALIFGIAFTAVGVDFFGFGGSLSLIIGICLLISAICAIISLIFIFKQDNYKMASMFLLIGSIAALITIIFGILGLILYALITKEQGRFKS